VARSLSSFLRSARAGIRLPVARAARRLGVAHLGSVIVSATARLTLPGARVRRRAFRGFGRMRADRPRLVLELLANPRR